MEVAPRYTQLTLPVGTVYTVDTVDTVETVQTVYTIETALHCLNIWMYAYIIQYKYCQERLERYWNGLLCYEQNVV